MTPHRVHLLMGLAACLLMAFTGSTHHIEGWILAALILYFFASLVRRKPRNPPAEG
jgi:hypothetical protein